MPRLELYVKKVMVGKKDREHAHRGSLLLIRLWRLRRGGGGRRPVGDLGGTPAPGSAVAPTVPSLPEPPTARSAGRPVPQPSRLRRALGQPPVSRAQASEAGRASHLREHVHLSSKADQRGTGTVTQW